jgi:hypothetical protein
MGDPSGDAGAAIAAYHRASALRAVEREGYETPGQYNEDLRARMVTPGEKMSHRVGDLLSILEIENVCPVCGAGLYVNEMPTMQYGGGWNTLESCPSCDYAEVYV